MNEKRPLDENIWRENLLEALDVINSCESFIFTNDIRQKILKKGRFANILLNA